MATILGVRDLPAELVAASPLLTEVWEEYGHAAQWLFPRRYTPGTLAALATYVSADTADAVFPLCFEAVELAERIELQGWQTDAKRTAALYGCCRIDSEGKVSWYSLEEGRAEAGRILSSTTLDVQHLHRRVYDDEALDHGWFATAPHLPPWRWVQAGHFDAARRAVEAGHCLTRQAYEEAFKQTNVEVMSWIGQRYPGVRAQKSWSAPLGFETSRKARVCYERVGRVGSRFVVHFRKELLEKTNIFLCGWWDPTAPLTRDAVLQTGLNIPEIKRIAEKYHIEMFPPDHSIARRDSVICAGASGDPNNMLYVIQHMFHGELDDRTMRCVCCVVVASGMASILEQVSADKYVDRGDVHRAIQHEYLDVLKWIYARKPSLFGQVYEWAARFGAWGVYDWALDQTIPFPENVSCVVGELAARGEQRRIERIMECREVAFTEFHPLVTAKAAANGHTRLVKWLVRHGAPQSPETILSAATLSRNMGLLLWLVQQGLPFAPRATYHAAIDTGCVSIASAIRAMWCRGIVESQPVSEDWIVEQWW